MPERKKCPKCGALVKAKFYGSHMHGNHPKTEGDKHAKTQDVSEMLNAHS